MTAKRTLLSDMKPIRGILMDIDNTLYPYAPTHQKALSATLSMLHQETGLALSTINTAFQAGRVKIKTELSETAAGHNRHLYFQRTCEELGLPVLPLAKRAADLYWDTFLLEMTLFPDVRDFLEALHPLPIVWVTDLTVDIQFRKLIQFGLVPLTAALVTSEETGHDKPHQSMFELAIQKLHEPPETLCMIGDDWERDILGATACGIQAIWFNPDYLEPTKIQAGIMAIGSYSQLLAQPDLVG